MSDQATISHNVSNVLERIEIAADRAGRSSKEITLVAVTKYVDSSVVEMLYHSGLRVFGESRPQVLWEKLEKLQLDDAQWHLIGHLQRNKVKRTLPSVSLVHSVDSIRLLEEIEKCAQVGDQVANILLEVNISGESAKHGLTSEQIKEMIDRSLESTHVNVLGLMGMGGLGSNETEVRSEFASLRTMRDQLSEQYQNESVAFPHLSMGMSGDFELAIAEGSTMVRIGSILFNGIDR